MTTLDLPSGFAGAVRGLTGRDGRYLTNERVIRDNEVEDYVLSTCWQGTTDPGPYNFGTGPVDWGKMLIGDAAFLFLRVRLETYPDEPYVFRVQCPNHFCKRHDKPFDWEIDLAKFLEERTQVMSEEARKTFKEGNRFEAVIPTTDKAYRFKLKTRADQKRDRLVAEQRKSASKKDKEKQNLMIESLLTTITEIDGVNSRNRAEMIDYLEDLPMRAIDQILADVQKPDCGVDTTIEVKCPACSTLQDVELPFDRGFFTPKATRRTKTSPESSSLPDEANELGAEAE